MGKKARKKQAAPAPAPVDAAAATPWWRKVLREPLALGLIVPILARPMLDGITYPTDNFYFVWAILILFALWGVRVLLRGEAIRFGMPALLLAGFWMVAALTALGAVQLDATYRTLILWAGHFFLFLLVANGVRSRTALAIVLSTFVVACLAETLWSLVHFKYVLPHVRELVKSDPRLLVRHFGTDNPGPELIHRLLVNRAFGTLLFPNALAAFLILGIPFLLGQAVHSGVTLTQELRTWRRDRSSRRPGSSLTVLIGGTATWLLVTCVMVFLFDFIATFEYPLQPGAWRLGPFVKLGEGGYQLTEGAHLLPCLFFEGLIPVLVGCAVAMILRRYGLRIFGLALSVWVLPPLFVLELAALWFTYSRGGILALLAAAVFTCGLLWLGRRRGRTAVGAAVAAALVVLCLLVAGTLGAAAVAQGEDGAAVEPIPPVAAPVQAPAPPRARAIDRITKEGVDLTLGDLANPASLSLRISYWQTGLRIALDNFWTGVGLGNFGTIYPKYQQIGAGDVQAAHNDYLQALCETGVFGLLFFAGFWLYFVLWGAWRLLAEKDATARWALGGLYCGVLAFLTHSLVDFNFFNPSLAFLAFLLTGVFYARASTADAPEAGGAEKEAAAPSGRRQLLALPLLVAAALVGGMAFRVYLSDFVVGGRSVFGVGNHHSMNETIAAGQFMLQRPDPEKLAQKSYPRKDILTIARLVPDRATLSGAGSIRVWTPGISAGHRALRPEEPVPDNAFFVLTKPHNARCAAREYAELYLEELGHADAIYPHNPELAAYFVRWYDMLVSQHHREDLRQRYTVEMLKWAEETVKRSPYQFIYREWLAKALWLRGNLDTGEARKTYFEKGLDEYRKATELYPIHVNSWRKYGDALIKYGEAQRKAADWLSDEAAAAEGFIERGKSVLGHANELEQAGAR